MSFYSDNNVKTRYFDPSTYVAGARAAFELDGNDLAYLPNMRIFNIGMSNTNAGGTATYNRLVGALGVIQNIRLLDGKTELSSLNNAALYRGFLNVNKRNDEVASVNGRLARSAMGYEVSDDGIVVAPAQPTDTIGYTTSAEDNHNLGYLDLRDVFPMLASVSHLPTAVFKNLRIEIVFTPDMLGKNLISPNNSGPAKGSRPVLGVDVLENPAIVNRLNKQLENASWMEIEHDRFRIPATATNGGAADQDVVQNTNVKLNGFNNKRIQRLLLVKQLNDPAMWATYNVIDAFGIYGSQNLYKETLQIRVNGRNIFPRQGLVGSNERLASLTDNFGPMLSYPASNEQGIDTAKLVVRQTDQAAQLDYDGVLIGDYINDLQIQIGRTGTHDANIRKPNTAEIQVHCYAEIMKTLRLNKNGTYNISYVQ